MARIRQQQNDNTQNDKSILKNSTDINWIGPNITDQRADTIWLLKPIDECRISDDEQLRDVQYIFDK